MQQYFTGTLTECSLFGAKLDALTGYPRPSTKTIRYGRIMPHAKIAGQYYIRLGEGYSHSDKRRFKFDDIDRKVASGTERAKFKTRAKLEQEEAFLIDDAEIPEEPRRTSSKKPNIKPKE